MIENILNQIDSVMYYPILIIVMTIAGLYFTLRTRGVPGIDPPSEGTAGG